MDQLVVKEVSGDRYTLEDWQRPSNKEGCPPRRRVGRESGFSAVQMTLHANDIIQRKCLLQFNVLNENIPLRYSLSTKRIHLPNWRYRWRDQRKWRWWWPCTVGSMCIWIAHIYCCLFRIRNWTTFRNVGIHTQDKLKLKQASMLFQKFGKLKMLNTEDQRPDNRYMRNDGIFDRHASVRSVLQNTQPALHN